MFCLVHTNSAEILASVCLLEWSLNDHHSTTEKKRDGSPSSPMSIPGDLCGHCNKKCALKGKPSEAIQCNVCYEWVHAMHEGSQKNNIKH